MNREVEIKLEVLDDSLLSRLSEFRLHRARHFEDNLLFDRVDELKSKSQVLRLRRAGDDWFVTYKGPASYSSTGIKSRDEIETKVADGLMMQAIWEQLGFQVVFRYQKYRTIYRTQDVWIMDDETPIGHFIELEGEASAIESVRKDLGLQEQPAILESYVGLFKLRRKAHAGPYMVF